MNRIARFPICALQVFLLVFLTVLQSATAAPSDTATARASAERAAAATLELPEYIGVLELMGDRTPRGAHVSRSYSYRAAGLALDIDVFDFDAAQLSAGIDSTTLKRQYAEAKAEARASAVGRAKLLGEGVVQFGKSRQFPAREAVFRLTQTEFEHTSYVWIASVQGRLLEMRFSVQEGFEDDGRVSRSEILEMLGEAVAHAPMPGAEQSMVAGVPQMNVAIVWDPQTPVAEHQLWMTYLMTRAAQAAKESANRELPVGDRQASFEEEVRARTMAVNAFRGLKTRDATLQSKYFSDLDRVEAAGFLREYAWTYLRHESWTPMPAGLRLKDFDSWRETHLTNHVPITHGRIALKLAATK